MRKSFDSFCGHRSFRKFIIFPAKKTVAFVVGGRISSIFSNVSYEQWKGVETIFLPYPWLCKIEKRLRFVLLARNYTISSRFSSRLSCPIQTLIREQTHLQLFCRGEVHAHIPCWLYLVIFSGLDTEKENQEENHIGINDERLWQVPEQWLTKRKMVEKRFYSSFNRWKNFWDSI